MMATAATPFTTWTRPGKRPRGHLGPHGPKGPLALGRLGDQTTRLLVRLQNRWRPSLVNLLVGLVVTEPAHFVMERKMLKTIKQLVERRRGDAVSA
jgi:hypothetical protein